MVYFPTLTIRINQNVGTDAIHRFYGMKIKLKAHFYTFVKYFMV